MSIPSTASTSSIPPQAAPRWFDFQVNGFGGIDFQSDTLSASELDQAVGALRRHGVAAIFATLITDTIDALCRRLENIERLCAASPSAARIIAGYHLEGPWLSPQPGYRGAHPAEPMHAPSIAEFARLQTAANGRIRLITLAPEWPGSDEAIHAITGSGVQVSLGHTAAEEAQIDAAVRAGARFCTHLGNGAPGELPRHNNIIQRLLARDELTACFIPDGIHLPPFVLRNFVRAKPANRILFTTDCMAGAGAPNGRYMLGKLAIDIGADRVARQPGSSGFAGSTLAPDEGVRRCCEYLGLTPEASAALWSTTAAAAFGVTLPQD